MKKSVKKNIILTSYKLFKENGFDNTTVNDICDACGITKTTFYRYLTSKEEILTYFFDQINDELGTVIVNMTNAENYYQQIIYAFDIIVNRMLHFGKDLYSQLYITNLKNYNGTFDEIPVLREIITVLIKKAQSANQIHNLSSPDDLYIACASITFGCGIQWCMDLIDDVQASINQQITTALQVDDQYRL